MPAENIEIGILDQNCASVIDRNFEISIEEIKEEYWKRILRNEIFIKKTKKIKSIRIPKLNCFKIVLSNTGEIPIEIGEIKLQYNNNIYNDLTAEYINKKYSLYTALNFHELLSLFELNVEDICSEDFDFKKDITKYNNQSIQPGHKVLKIIVFIWIPVQIRKLSISIVLKSDIIQKIVDFRLRRFEYRQSGNYFVKPINRDNE